VEPDLDDLYDERTLRRLARATTPPAASAESAHGAPLALAPSDRPRPRLATGVLLGALLGLQDVLEGHDRREPVIEVAPDPGAEPVRGVSLFFVPGQPQATVAVVR
jgi:hypothetical protein